MDSKGDIFWSFTTTLVKTDAAGKVLKQIAVENHRGDRHWAELSKTTEHAPYPIYDLTSSSLNQKHPRGTPTQNKYRNVETTYHSENFGAIGIDWTKPDPQLTLQIIDLTGKTRIEKTLSLKQLSPGD